ncbi:MAG: hypothetical protein Q7S14_01905 [bacterium]|nr:hypothetical protein [bacterium]
MKSWQIIFSFLVVFGLILLILYLFPVAQIKIIAPENFSCGDIIVFKNIPPATKTLTFESVDNYKEENLDPKIIEYKPKCSFTKNKNFKFILTAVNDKNSVISKAELVGVYGK